MVTIQINESSKAAKAFIEFAKNLPFVKIEEKYKQEQATKMKDSIVKAISEANAIEKAKSKPQNLIEFLDEV